ncbi:DUF3558 domain-containing protein [Streptomyces sp. NPDC021080]|uniref:DUF3558 domain-containing protein n=1 Tax=Streptomyces sp. NPDC021080 TaxID=3365110 RepID=UPI00379D9800
MQRKAYVSAAAMLLAAVLAGCTGGSGVGGSAPDSKGGDTGTTAPVAQPGKYRTLPEACGAADHDTLDTLLPGIQETSDEAQQEKAYAGEATLTYDTDRRDGCDWKVASAATTDHLFVDFERVVSYDNTVSDESKAEELFATKQTSAGLPAPAASASTSAAATPSPSDSAGSPAADNAGGDNGDASGAPSGPASGVPSGSASGASASQAPADLQPRVLDDLGDEAFLDDKLSTGSSTAQQRTVTVVFRTSNVIVTIEYSEQPTASASAPDSKEMQDRAQKLAQKLASRLND